jgi:peroxiredoxin
MSQQHAGVSPAAKKGVVLFILIVAAVLLLLLLLVPRGPRGPRIIGEGDRAPEFRLTSLDGRQVSLSDFKGKVVMVHFWATWCPPCVEEMPTIEKLYRNFQGKDFEILAVSVDEGGPDAIRSFLKQNRLTLPVLLDPGAPVSKTYGTFKFPETYIVDRNGIVKYKAIGPRDWSDPATIKALQDLIEAR